METAERVKVPVEQFLENLNKLKGESDKVWVNPKGDHEAKLMIILSYPGVDALEEDDLLAGPNGVELSNALDLAGLSESDYYLTTMVKHGIGSNSKPTNQHIADCSAALDYEIEVVKPQLILTLGAEPFKRVMKENAKITDYIGNIIDCPYGKLLPNFSPGMIVTQDPRKRPQFREVFDLAKKFVNNTLQYTPYEYIVVDDVETSKAIVQHYIDNKMLTIGYDAEWCGMKMTDDEVMYTFQYSCEPHKAIILDISKDGVNENRELLLTVKPLIEHPQAERMGWNIRADDKRLKLRGINPLEETLAFDGMKACGFLDSRWPKGLETGIKYFTNYRPYYKELTTVLKANKLSYDQMSKAKFVDPNTFYDYCGGDAVAHRTACLGMRERMMRLPAKQRDYYFNIYLPLSNYLLDLELTGIPIDIDVLDDLTKKYQGKYNELKEKLLGLTKKHMEEFNPNSVIDKKKLLFDILKLEPAFYTKSGKSAKSRAWYEKQKTNVQKQYSPSTNGKSLATIFFDLEKAMRVDDSKELKDKHEIVKTMLDLGRVGVFANKFLDKTGTTFDDVESEGGLDDEGDEEGKKTSYWNAICKDKRIHPDFFECLKNFRSSSKPNVQNPASKVLSHIPAIFIPGYAKMTKEEKKLHDKDIPRNIRHIFYGGGKDWHWAEVDVAGADLAIAAFVSGDKKYIKDILKGNFHLTKAREYFADPNVSKDDYSRYVSAKAITFRVAYTAELMSAALPIQAEIYAESGIYVDTDRIEYALKTWENYDRYMEFRNECTEQVEKEKCIDNQLGIRYHFEDSEDFKILAGWKNESLAYPIASELALFLWNVSVAMKKQLKKDGQWLKNIFPVNSVHDASYWTVHKDLMKDNYFPELCKYFFTKHCKITTGDNLGMEMVVADRWKGKESVFHGETQWNFEKKCWDWKK